MKTTIYQTPETRRKDSFWFDGHVATISNKKAKVNIIATGAIQVSFAPNEDYLRDGHAVKEARSMGYTDRKLRNISKHDGWSNNNWFAFEIVRDGKATWSPDTETKFDDAIRTAKQILKDEDF